MTQIYKNTAGGGGGGTVLTLTGDSGGPVPPSAGGNINILGNPDIENLGTPGTNTMQLTDLTKLTYYVVGPLGQTGYQDIQSAINAFKTIFGAHIIYVWPGLYIQSLDFTGFTFPCNVHIRSVPLHTQSAIDGVTIVGNITPPDTGAIFFEDVNVECTSGNVFDSASAGTSTIWLRNCDSQTTGGGFIFNLPNWTSSGVVVVENLSTGGPAVATSLINNTGGVQLSIRDSNFVGSLTGSSSVISGTTEVLNSNIYCPLNFSTGSSINSRSSTFNNAVTCSSNSTGTFVNCYFNTGATTPLTMSSSASVNLYNNTINSSANPVIAGAGAGSLTLLNNTFSNNQQIAATVVTPNLLHQVRGTAQTINVGTADLITYTLRNVASVYQFEALISGISVAGSAAGFQLTGVIKSNGAASTIVGTVDAIANLDLAIAGANVTVIASGNTLICRATGSLGSVINWNVNLTFKEITN